MADLDEALIAHWNFALRGILIEPFHYQSNIDSSLYSRVSSSSEGCLIPTRRFPSNAVHWKFVPRDILIEPLHWATSRSLGGTTLPLLQLQINIADNKNRLGISWFSHQELEPCKPFQQHMVCIMTDELMDMARIWRGPGIPPLLEHSETPTRVYLYQDASLSLRNYAQPSSMFWKSMLHPDRNCQLPKGVCIHQSLSWTKRSRSCCVRGVTSPSRPYIVNSLCLLVRVASETKSDG